MKTPVSVLSRYLDVHFFQERQKTIFLLGVANIEESRTGLDWVFIRYGYLVNTFYNVLYLICLLFASKTILACTSRRHFKYVIYVK